MLAGGSNLVVADDGFAGTVVKVATRGVTPDTDDDDATCGGVLVTVAAGRTGTTWSPVPSRRAGWGSRRCRASPALSAPRPSRTSAPTARRSPRPSPRSGSGTGNCGHPDLRQRRLRLRLPAQQVQGGPRSPRRALGDLPVPPGQPRRPGGVRRARPHAGRLAGRAPRGGPLRRPRPARGQGHGARRGGPRHLERRVVLHEPGRRGGRRPGRGARLAAGQRVGEVERRVADRARRVHQGLRQRGRQPVDQAHARAHQPRRRAHHRPARPRPRGPRRRRGPFGIRLVNEPVLVGCEI